MLWHITNKSIHNKNEYKDNVIKWVKITHLQCMAIQNSPCTNKLIKNSNFENVFIIIHYITCTGKLDGQSDLTRFTGTLVSGVIEILFFGYPIEFF